ncbi:uncharacterized protein ACR2FA_001964 [Aphomia sociella]
MVQKKHTFTALEKKTFINILKKYKDFIENKDTDSATLKKKNVAWRNIAQEFNASPNNTTQSNDKQLRRLWMNLKQRRREALKRKAQYQLAGEGSSSSDAVIYMNIGSDSPTGTSSPHLDSAHTSFSRNEIEPVETNSIIQREYENEEQRVNALHDLELKLLKEKIREAKAKADLAELILLQHQSKDISNAKSENTEDDE